MANIVHRKARKLPSTRKHGFSAVLLLALIALSTFSWLQFSAKKVNISAHNGPEFQLSPPEIPQETIAVALPDLLKDDNIPMDVNPTDVVDLIGGPERQNVTTGPRPPSNTPITTGAPSSTSGPKTILIDGKPLIDGKFITNGSAGVQTNTSPPLIRAPIQGLTRMSPFGRVPTMNENGRTVITSYAKPFSPLAGKSYASIVIGGLGLNQDLTTRAINELPGEISLSFAAQAPDLQNWIHKARARGHEVLIELPMQSAGFNAAAEGATYTLNITGPDSTNIRNLDYLMSRAEGYFAVTNYGGDVLVRHEKSLKPILEHLKNAGLGFVYDGEDKAARIQVLGRKYALPIVTANLFLDTSSHDKNTVTAAIRTLKPTRTGPVPIGMGFAYGGTIDGVKDWLKIMPVNIGLAPVSYALKTNP